MKLKTFCFLILLTWMLSIIFAITYVLNDGQTIKGKVLEKDAYRIILQTADTLKEIKIIDINKTFLSSEEQQDHRKIWANTSTHEKPENTFRTARTDPHRMRAQMLERLRQKIYQKPH